MRGTRGIVHRCPAGAGDHPRVCGEHVPSFSAVGEEVGSSPRMRGTHLAAVFDAGVRRIIPAYAGNTVVAHGALERPWDHPRVCGEHRAGDDVQRPDRGSSPRMRGTPVCHRLSPFVTGIIPAYAGNTQRRRTPRQHGRDHPRVCGEHTTHADGLIPVKGSSPRMRGTLHVAARCGVLPGIIPAYAGNTWSDTWPAPMPRDHPRVCGEHLHGLQDRHRGRGSSPRMRGTPKIHDAEDMAVGIIPAYAGNTTPRNTVESCNGDHPRVCGEHWWGAAVDVVDEGSSPRMRGTPGRAPSCRPPSRIIPAYAGNTWSDT